MMSNYDRTMELVDAAYNSTGASQEQFEKTLDSLETKLEKLGNAWTEFTTGITNSSAIKFVVDALTAILDIINDVTGALGDFGGGIAKVLVAFAGIKIGKSLFNKFFASIGTIFFQGGRQAGEQLDNGLQKNLKKVSLSLRTWAKTINNQLKRNIQINGNSFSSISQAFSNVPREIQSEINAKMPQIGQSFINDFKNAINYDSLTDEGKAKADEFIMAFQQRMREGNSELALRGLQQAATGRNTNANWASMGGENVQNLEASDNTINTLNKSMMTLGSTVGAVGAGFNNFASILDGLGLNGIANSVRSIGSAFSSIGGIVSSVGSIITAAGISSQAAWWWIFAIIAAVTLLTAGIVALVNTAKENSLAGQMEKVQKATDAASETANSAKEAYDNLLNARSEYFELQQTLDNLIKGTNEWKQALLEANAQVLELLTNYPQLAQYISRGKSGQLIVSDKGFDELIEQQLESMQRAQMAVISSQMQKIRTSDQVAERELAKQFQIIIDPNLLNNTTIESYAQSINQG